MFQDKIGYFRGANKSLEKNMLTRNVNFSCEVSLYSGPKVYHHDLYTCLFSEDIGLLEE